MSFTLPVAQSHSKALDENLAGMILVGQDRPRLSYQPLGGLLTGFIDLIFEDNGKYYLIDYKTNKLNSGYDDKQCQKAMLAHRYDLQAMIYLLALHRLLSTRLPHYDYEQHMGGAIYWFIRASNTELPMQGFWHFKPSLAELTQFSDFFRSNPS
jgi:exodeoxyribonuclease V beta subunit